MEINTSTKRNKRRFTMGIKFKQIKLRRINSKKFCLKCGEIMDIEIQNLDGFCCGCLEQNINTRLFTLNPKTKGNGGKNENK